MEQAITADDAINLAKRLNEVATEIGDRLFRDWVTLEPSDRAELEDAFWSLSNSATEVITQAVGVILETSDTSVARLETYTSKAQQVIKTTKDIKKAIGVATAMVGLAAAIASKDPGAIVRNAETVYLAAQSEP